MQMDRSLIKDFLDEKYEQYASAHFIQSDPIQVPHNYSNPADIEISGFLTATLSWGQRPMIIRYAKELMNSMGESPYDFVMHFNKGQWKRAEKFQYRTFTGIDCIAFLQSLKMVYLRPGGLKGLFLKGYSESGTVKGAISSFRHTFLSNHFPLRTQKHVSNPSNGSAAKRINMFLRWMVRPPKEKIDFGLWPEIPTSALMLPLDLHTGRVGRKLKLLHRKQSDWKAVEEITLNLHHFDPNDPIKYDIALFGLGIFEKF
jgi:uncharacterized protein (TIGR02757 family)